MSIIKQLNENSEVFKVYKHQRDAGLTGDPLWDAVANDLEMLEYSPEDIEKAIKLLKSGK